MGPTCPSRGPVQSGSQKSFRESRMSGVSVSSFRTRFLKVHLKRVDKWGLDLVSTPLCILCMSSRVLEFIVTQLNQTPVYIS